MSDSFPEGNAIVYCEGAYQSTNGKTAHGLVRRCHRYQVIAVVDSTCAGRDAGQLLDGLRRNIPVVGDVEAAIDLSRRLDRAVTHLVIGLAPDGGRLPSSARSDVENAIRAGLHVDSGLHDFLSDDARFAQLASESGVTIRDVRKPPPRGSLHFFSGKIEQVDSLKIAVLGTDSAVGKRTTAWLLVDALEDAGLTATMVGTGQTAWLQGSRHGIVMDALVNDFVSGEIEHAVWSAWNDERPHVIVIEGQGSLLNPAYPGGFEILAAARPDVVLLQHAPARREYDGFPGYRIHSLDRQIRAIEVISDCPVVAITLNHERLQLDDIPKARRDLEQRSGLPVFDLLDDDAARLITALRPFLLAKRLAPTSPPVQTADSRPRFP